MSLDAAVIDLSRAFEYGQGYVALSRLKSLKGLYLLGLNERALRVHPKAVEKDAEFRAASDAAQGAISANDLAGRQAAFLAACLARSQAAPAAGPRKPRSSAHPKSYDVAALRETRSKAYAPWSTTEENDLARRHSQGETIKSIAASLGRQPGAIRSRLKKLALI